MYAFGALFFIFRITFYPFTIWKLVYGYSLFPSNYPLFKYRVSLVLSIGYTMLYFLQIFWFYKIIASLQKQGKRTKKE